MLIGRLTESDGKKDWQVLLSSLEILHRVLIKLGYDDSKWKWPPVFDSLIAPGLTNTNPDVRRVAIDVVVFLLTVDEAGVNSRLQAIDGIKQSLLASIAAKSKATKSPGTSPGKLPKKLTAGNN